MTWWHIWKLLPKWFNKTFQWHVTNSFRAHIYVRIRLKQTHYECHRYVCSHTVDIFEGVIEWFSRYGGRFTIRGYFEGVESNQTGKRMRIAKWNKDIENIILRCNILCMHVAWEMVAMVRIDYRMSLENVDPRIHKYYNSMSKWVLFCT